MRLTLFIFNRWGMSVHMSCDAYILQPSCFWLGISITIRLFRILFNGVRHLIQKLNIHSTPPSLGGLQFELLTPKPPERSFSLIQLLQVLHIVPCISPDVSQFFIVPSNFFEYPDTWSLARQPQQMHCTCQPYLQHWQPLAEQLAKVLHCISTWSRHGGKT